MVRQVGHLLPAQGPISVFIHHNTLHAFEHLPFDDAVVEAARLHGCRPYLPEDDYRQALRKGRILDSDIVAVLAAELGARAGEAVVGQMSRLELRHRILAYGIPERLGPTLQWVLEETDVLERLRTDLPSAAREPTGLGRESGTDRREEARYVQALWSACRAVVECSEPAAPDRHSRPVRHRDLLLAALGVDVDAWIHPILIRFTSAFLDQGLADWAMPGRERGLYRCFLDLYRGPLARLCEPIGRELQQVVRAEREESPDGMRSLSASLERLGVAEGEWSPFLCGEALALPGFAGMVHQFELRPDRVPTQSVPARLVDFLAVRLLIERAALEHAATRIDFHGELAELRPWLRRLPPDSSAPAVDERAWPLFQVAQLAGWSAANIGSFDVKEVERIEAELRELDGTARCRTLHCAYERHLRHRFFDALVRHRPAERTEPTFQAIFCMDDREESIRRHLEEVEPSAETFGVAGFFGVAMYYRGATDAHPRPLCPVALRPRHFVDEVDVATPRGVRGRFLRQWGRVGALVDKNVHFGSRRVRSGAVLFAALGVLWVVPLVMRVWFPWLNRAITRSYDTVQPRVTRLGIEHRPAQRPPLGEQSGFTTDEMADIVFSQLVAIGIRNRFAPLVVLLGHGSTSLNNPHESAHDCGACGGGRGGANARAFAQMANLPDVRAKLERRGLCIPTDTWFVGGERNTASNDISIYDADLAPVHVIPALRRAMEAFERARRREAHERCRRFESAGAWLPTAASLWHVQKRSADLAQPRPEYGHATNAFCFVGRRATTRGLFLDRRAFLVSYDPNGDPDGAQLGELLAAVVPVVAGISLEYLFGYVDPAGYGSGTKLPHNVTGLVGVMDGAQSDLRTGLPWQMLEIHEPVRLSIVVEADVAIVRRLLAQSADVERLVDQRWVFLAALDPSSGELVELDPTSTNVYEPEHPLPVSRGDSRAHYEGRRGHLPFAAIERPIRSVR